MEEVTRAADVIDLSGDDNDHETAENDDDATQFESQAAEYLKLLNMAAYMTPRTLMSQALDIQSTPGTPPPPVSPRVETQTQQDSGFDTTEFRFENSNGEYHNTQQFNSNNAVALNSGDVTNLGIDLPENGSFSHNLEQSQDVSSKKTQRIRIPARLLVPFTQISNNSQSQSQQPYLSQQQPKSQPQAPMYQKMRREIKRLKSMVRKLKVEKSESEEKAKRYLTQSTLTGYGIKCLKHSSGGVSPKLLKSISQQMADTFYTPAIIVKRQNKSPGKSRKKARSSPLSPEIIASKPTVPEISDKTWGLLSFRSSQLSQIC